MQTCQTKPTYISFKIGPNNSFWVISLNSEFERCSSSNGCDNFLVQFLATREEVQVILSCEGD